MLAGCRRRAFEAEGQRERFEGTASGPRRLSHRARAIKRAGLEEQGACLLACLPQSVYVSASPKQRYTHLLGPAPASDRPRRLSDTRPPPRFPPPAQWELGWEAGSSFAWLLGRRHKPVCVCVSLWYVCAEFWPLRALTPPLD